MPDRDAACETVTLAAVGGIEVVIARYGATVVRLRMPDRSGTMGDVVLGFENAESYREPHPYFGSTVGRYANRIAHGRFVLDEIEVNVTRNLAQHHLHGGRVGFDKAMWDVVPELHTARPAVVLRHLSPDGDEGYPGALAVDVRYTLVDAWTLDIEYIARTDCPTVVNLTNHAYFNLADGGATDVFDHRLRLAASYVTPTDAAGIPTGEIASVQDTALDFRVARSVGEKLGGALVGYDHNYVVDGWDGHLRSVAHVSAPQSGRTLEIATTQPGIQLYTAAGLDGTLRGHGGRVYGSSHALCLETQHFPDSPNHRHFPSTRLAPGDLYRERTQWRFGVAP